MYQCPWKCKDPTSDKGYSYFMGWAEAEKEGAETTTKGGGNQGGGELSGKILEELKDIKKQLAGLQEAVFIIIENTPSGEEEQQGGTQELEPESEV